MNHHPSYLNVLGEDPGSPSSSSSDGSVEPHQTHSSFHPIQQAPPPVWPNTERPALPPSPIHTTNSFDHATSPFALRNTFEQQGQPLPHPGETFAFEGFPDRPEDTKQFGASPPPHPPSALGGAFHPTNVFSFHPPPFDDHQQFHPVLEPPQPNPFVSQPHMVYRFEPHYLPSTWHAMYKPTENMMDRNPAAVPSFSPNRPAMSPVVKSPGALPALFPSSPPPTVTSASLSPAIPIVPEVASRDPESSFAAASNNTSTRAAAAGSSPPATNSPPKPQPATRRSKKVRGGRRQPMSPQHRGTLAHEEPSDHELENAATNRAKKAIYSWYERFNELVDYANKFGDTAVPQQYPDNHALGIWVNKQRMEMKAFVDKSRGSMTKRRMDLLEKINFEWAKPKGVAAWDEKFEELKEYKETHGDCHVPTKHKGNRPLGRWVSTQRNMKKNYDRGITPKSLSQQEIHRRIELLEGIGFAWSMLDQDSPTNSQGSNRTS